MAPPQLKDDAHLAARLSGRWPLWGHPRGQQLRRSELHLSPHPVLRNLGRSMNGKPFKRGTSWYVRWTDEHGHRRKKAFERHTDAQRFLNVETGRLSEVQQGLRQPTPGNRTFDELADYYLENRSTQKRSAHHDISIVRAHLRPFFGKMLLKNVGVAAVDQFIALKGHLNKKTLANLLTLLISMLNVAVDLEWLLKGPRIRKPKVRIFSRDYRYLRTGEEVRRFLVGAKAPLLQLPLRRHRPSQGLLLLFLLAKSRLVADSTRTRSEGSPRAT